MNSNQKAISIGAGPAGSTTPMNYLDKTDINPIFEALIYSEEMACTATTIGSFHAHAVTMVENIIRC